MNTYNLICGDEVRMGEPIPCPDPETGKSMSITPIKKNGKVIFYDDLGNDVTNTVLLSFPNGTVINAQHIIPELVLTESSTSFRTRPALS